MTSADLSFYRSPIFEEVRARARAEGAVEVRVDSVLITLEARGVPVPEAVRERITGCGDPEILRQWLRRAVVVGVAEDVFVGG